MLDLLISLCNKIKSQKQIWTAILMSSSKMLRVGVWLFSWLSWLHNVRHSGLFEDIPFQINQCCRKASCSNQVWIEQLRVLLCRQYYNNVVDHPRSPSLCDGDHECLKKRRKIFEIVLSAQRWWSTDDEKMSLLSEKIYSMERMIHEQSLKAGVFKLF